METGGSVPATGGRLLRRMRPRRPDEAHRVATPLELLFDLCFVVAIAQAAAALHHSVAQGHALHGGILSYGLVFFAIWWAWMGFAWFASAFDTDDVAYRIKVLVQMFGVLVLAAGVPRAFEHRDFLLMTVGYSIMRVGLVAQWWRASRAAPAHRRTARRYAVGITLCQFGWIALLFVPNESWVFGWCVLAPLELLVPIWAERAQRTCWHPHHIAERYGLLTIIVIGESVLAGTLAVQSSMDAGVRASELVWVILAAPLIVFSMWWLYFQKPHHEILGSMRRAFLWGYGHFLIFASAAAVGAALAVAVDQATGRTTISDFAAGQALAVPVVLYLSGLWFTMVRPREQRPKCGIAVAVAAGLILLAPFSPAPPFAVGIVLAALTAFVVVADARSADGAPPG